MNMQVSTRMYLESGEPAKGIFHGQPIVWEVCGVLCFVHVLMFPMKSTALYKLEILNQ